MASPQPKRPFSWWFRYPFVVACLVLLAVMAVVNTVTAPPEPTRVELSQAVEHIKDGDVVRAEIRDGANQVELVLKKGTKTVAAPSSDTEEKTSPADAKEKAATDDRVVASYPFAYSDTLTELLVDEKTPVATVPPKAPNPLSSLLFAMLPIVVILGFLYWMLKSGAMGGGIGKLSGKRGQAIGEVPTARFTDVAGADEAVTELSELVAFLQDPTPFTAVGAKAPRGALLVGPPGTGKTLLARAVAGEAGVPFFPIAGSDFVETFVGVGAKRVRQLFDNARKSPAGAIIFIDEIDAVGRKRSGQQGNAGDSERENTLISMLNEMDGFDTGHKIIVLAATNRAETLDPALTRPGRLDHQIQVPAPDRRGREQILAVHARSKPIDPALDWTAMARRTPGMAGAELEQLINEACMEAARAKSTTVRAHHFDAALATIALGRARVSALVTDHDRKITAWHEAGHTVTALLQDAADDPVQVSIVPRGPAGGVTWMAGSDDVFMTRRKALAQLRVAMGGRAAEEILLDGDYTTGAHGDLTSATSLALAMVTKYGMSEAGLLLVDDQTITMGSEVGQQVRDVADKLLREAHADARAMLRESHELLEAIANALLEEENLALAEIRALQAQVSGAAAACSTPPEAEPLIGTDTTLQATRPTRPTN